MERIDLPAGTIDYRAFGPPARRTADRVRARVPRRLHPLVVGARAAGPGRLPHLRAHLAVGRAPGGHAARRRPLATGRRDVSAFAQAWTGDELQDSARWLEKFDQPVLLCRAPEDPFPKIRLGRQLASTFPGATLVEFPGARTFVSLDQPERLAEEILGWLGGRSA